MDRKGTGTTVSSPGSQPEICLQTPQGIPIHQTPNLEDTKEGPPQVKAIGCVRISDGGIGYQGKLLYHIKEDLARFQKQTWGGVLVMGRKTWESLPGKLPGRIHVVLTRDPSAFLASSLLENSSPDHLCSDKNQTLHWCRQQYPTRTIWIIGGDSMWRLFAPLVTEWWWTEINDLTDDPPPADTFLSCDVPVSVIPWQTHTKIPVEYRFCVFPSLFGGKMTDAEFEERWSKYRESFKRRARSGIDPIAQYNEADGFSYYMGANDWDVALHAPEMCQRLYKRNAQEIKNQYGDLNRLDRIKDSAAYVAQYLK